MRTLLANNAASAGLLVFFLLGWSYYVASRALMSGALFARLRRFVDQKAGEARPPFRYLNAMLGCLMCTSMQLSLGTLGLLMFALGLYFHAADDLIAAAWQALGVLTPRQALRLPLLLELAVLSGISVAASFAVSGEAWAIKTIVEHRERKFLALRNEFRQKEEDLRRQIIALAEQLSAECLSLGEVLIPFEYFERILAAVDVRCRATRCPFSLTRCRLEQIESEIRIWGRGRLTPGSLELYAVIFSSALRDSTALYWALWGYEMPDARAVYAELRRALDRALAARPSIRTVSGDRRWRDRRDGAPPAGHGRPRRKRRRASRNDLSSYNPRL